jgi:hypothetical protein
MLDADLFAPAVTAKRTPAMIPFVSSIEHVDPLHRADTAARTRDVAASFSRAIRCAGSK